MVCGSVLFPLLHNCHVPSAHLLQPRLCRHFLFPKDSPCPSRDYSYGNLVEGNCEQDRTNCTVPKNTLFFFPGQAKRLQFDAAVSNLTKSTKFSLIHPKQRNTVTKSLSSLSLSLSTYTYNIYMDKYISPSESVQGGSCSISYSLYKVYTLQFSSQPLKCSFVTLPTLPSLTLRASTLPPQHFASPWPGSVDWPSPHSNLGAEL